MKHEFCDSAILVFLVNVMASRPTGKDTILNLDKYSNHRITHNFKSSMITTSK